MQKNIPKAKSSLPKSSLIRSRILASRYLKSDEKLFSIIKEEITK